MLGHDLAFALPRAGWRAKVHASTEKLRPTLLAQIERKREEVGGGRGRTRGRAARETK
jgi:hypothetical protein